VRNAGGARPEPPAAAPPEAPLGGGPGAGLTGCVATVELPPPGAPVLAAVQGVAGVTTRGALEPDSADSTFGALKETVVQLAVSGLPSPDMPQLMLSARRMACLRLLA